MFEYRVHFSVATAGKYVEVITGMDADEKLIEAVRGYSSLWLVNSKAYKDTIAKGNAWKVKLAI